jgi:hypothetical protein
LSEPGVRKRTGCTLLSKRKRGEQAAVVYDVVYFSYVIVEFPRSGWSPEQKLTVTFTPGMINDASPKADTSEHDSFDTSVSGSRPSNCPNYLKLRERVEQFLDWLGVGVLIATCLACIHETTFGQGHSASRSRRLLAHQRVQRHSRALTQFLSAREGPTDPAWHHAFGCTQMTHYRNSGYIQLSCFLLPQPRHTLYPLGAVCFSRDTHARSSLRG